MNIHQRVTEMTVCAVPEDHPDWDLYAVRVAYRGEDRYAVKHMSRVLTVGEHWEYEPIPSERDDGFKARARFDYLRATELAVKHAPHVVVSGRSAAQALSAWQRGAV